MTLVPPELGRPRGHGRDRVRTWLILMGIHSTHPGVAVAQRRGAAQLNTRQQQPLPAGREVQHPISCRQGSAGSHQLQAGREVQDHVGCRQGSTGSCLGSGFAGGRCLLAAASPAQAVICGDPHHCCLLAVSRLPRSLPLLHESHRASPTPMAKPSSFSSAARKPSQAQDASQQPARVAGARHYHRLPGSTILQFRKGAADR